MDMKKHFLIFSTLAFAAGLTAFGFIKDRKLNDPIANIECKSVPLNEMSCNTPIASFTPVANIFEAAEPIDFFYDFGSRFNPITKEALSKARTISDFIDENEIPYMEGVRSTTLIVIENDVQTDKRISGKSEKLTAEQLKMIESMEYSTHFLLRTEFRTKDPNVQAKGENIYHPHMTVVPEKQAAFTGGKNGLLDFLRQKNKKNIYHLDINKLKPAKLYFTVAKNGDVENIKLDRSSGYDAIDQEMIKLVNNLPGKWEPAENALGQKVEQVFVISFGMVGC